MKNSEFLCDEISKIEPLSEEWIKRAWKRLDSLIKPKRSLGILEEIAARVVAIKEEERPRIEKKAVFVFASDHGVTEEGVSVFPKSITYEMVRNFLKGIAAINVLSRKAGADVFVVDIGVDADISEESPFLIKRKIRRGTENISKTSAMKKEEAEDAIKVGIEVADMAKSMGYSMIATGDMGIGNTTASSALLCALLRIDPEEVVGTGTGIDEKVLKKKIDVVKKALDVNRHLFSDPISTLSAVGGLEIAGICGMCLGGAKNRMIVVVDGFIASCGALVAMMIQPNVKDYLFFSHLSAEKGHRIFFEKIGERPILDLRMKLGEGTGAALAMHIIESALSIYNEMATFEEAGIDEIQAQGKLKDKV